MTVRKLEFGYHPRPLRIQAGPVTVNPLTVLARTVADVDASDGVEGDWIYAPRQPTCGFGDEVRIRPYAARVFGLPKTHAIEHASPDNEDHLTFHLWALSFFTGLRLTATEAGFLDATPLKPGKLVDFVLHGPGLAKSVELAEAFWRANRSDPQPARLFAAAVHALFLGQNPRHLQFEGFVFLYTALDACYKLATLLHPQATKSRRHAERVDWMCGLFGIATPSWAEPAASEVAGIRNLALHEGLFMGEPLGFALHGVGTSRNLTLEMEAVICRLLVALLGGSHTLYVRSPINTRQRHGLDLS